MRRLHQGSAVLAALILVGCSGSPTAPGSKGSASGDGTGNAGNTTEMTQLVVSGPGSVAVGQTVTWKAEGTFEDGSKRDMTARSQWSSAAPGIASAGAGGQVTGVSPGNTTITATVEGMSASGGIVVTDGPAPTVVSLAVTGDTTIKVDETSQLQATATMSDGTTQTVTNSSAWASAATGIATVSSTGLVTGVSPGQAPITATYQGKSASVTMEVSPNDSGGPQVIGLSIQGTTCNTVGPSSQLEAIAQMSDGTTQNRTATAAWTTGDPGVAVVSKGLVRCTGPGQTTITATIPGPFSASVIVTVAASKQLIGIRVDVEGNVLTGNGHVGLSLSSLLQDPLLTVNVFALYSDGSEQNVTALTAISTSTPLLVVNGPGVVNAAGVLTQALINPSHYINVTYQGFTVIVNVVINVPVLGQLPIKGLALNGTLASLSVGTKLPDLTAILSGPGVSGTVNLLIPAATPGIQWNIRPRLLSNCGLLAAVCATVNAALQGLGNLANGVVTIVDGKVTHLTLGPLNAILAPVVSLMGGVLEVDVNPIINGVVGPGFLCRIPL